MKKIIIANWKANPTSDKEITQYFSKFNPKTSGRIVFCPPFVYLKDFSKGDFQLGAQNCFWENQGAFTGEITPLMLKNIGCEYVIIGHSERRMIFSESCEIINSKIRKIQENNLKVVYCVGEKEGEDFNKILKEQIEKELNHVDLENIIVAYEPVWAIGTGKACDVKTAETAKKKIIETIGREIPVLYGGSVNQENAGGFLEIMDGLLVGTSSLDPVIFEKICNLTN
ncbi:MAG TPA: triose-phosphate isomerase [Candidatus Pacearchaeota archaeon]|nr:triose-phosphate isomerase [Candidatus Parcubacteria bacterium]HNZ83726.1 triose-phosphate isomerase [Candidatus Pacearchaeota archaeon]